MSPASAGGGSPSLHEVIDEDLSGGPGPEETRGRGSNRWTAELPAALEKNIRRVMMLPLMWVMVQSNKMWMIMETLFGRSQTGEAGVRCDINKTASHGYIGTSWT